MFKFGTFRTIPTLTLKRKTRHGNQDDLSDKVIKDKMAKKLKYHLRHAKLAHFET